MSETFSIDEAYGRRAPESATTFGLDEAYGRSPKPGEALATFSLDEAYGRPPKQPQMPADPTGDLTKTPPPDNPLDGARQGDENEAIRQAMARGDRPSGLPTEAAPSVTAMPRDQRPGVGQQFVNDLGRGVDQLQAVGFGLVGMAGDAVGVDSVADWGLAGYKRNMDEAKTNPPVIGSYRNIATDSISHFGGDVGRYAVEAVVENLPMFLPSLATGGIGALAARQAATGVVGGLIEQKIAQGLTRDAAEKAASEVVARRIAIGGTAGAYPSAAGLEAGSIYGDVEEKTGERRPGVAAGYGAVAGVLEVIPEAMALTRMLRPAVAERVAGGVLRRLGVEGAKQFFTEGGTEALQTVLENAAVTHVDPRKELWSAENIDDMIDSALKGGLAGGIHGVTSEGAGHMMRSPLLGGRPTDIAPPNVTPADVASPIPTDLIASGRSIVDGLLTPKSDVADLPQGAVPAELLLWRVAEPEKVALPPSESPTQPTAEPPSAAPEPASLPDVGVRVGVIAPDGQRLEGVVISHYSEPRSRQRTATGVEMQLDDGRVVNIPLDQYRVESIAPAVQPAPLNVTSPTPLELGPAPPLAEIPAPEPPVDESAPASGSVAQAVAQPAKPPTLRPTTPAFDLTGLRELDQQDAQNDSPDALRPTTASSLSSQQDRRDSALPIPSADTPSVGSGRASAPASMAAPIMKKDGSPFSTAKSAELAVRSRPDLKGQSLEPVRVDGGWGLRAVDRPVVGVPEFAQPESQAPQGFRGEVDQQVAPTPKPVQPPAATSPRKKLQPMSARVENYYRPGRIVQGYGGQRDRVIAFEPAADGTPWRVRVVRVDQDGGPVAGERERVHSTAPTERDLRAWEKENPVDAARPATPDASGKASTATQTSEAFRQPTTKEEEARQAGLSIKRTDLGSFQKSRANLPDASTMSDRATDANRNGGLRAVDESPTPGERSADDPRDADNLRAAAAKAGDERNRRLGKAGVQRDAAGEGSADSVKPEGGDSLHHAPEFIRAPDGSRDFGAITPEMGRALGREAAPIRLRVGDDREGLRHIHLRHNDDAQALGYPSVEAMVADWARNFDAIYQGRGRSLILAKRIGKTLLGNVVLEPMEGGAYYDVKNVTPGRADQFKNKNPLWERTGPSVSPTEVGSVDPSDQRGDSNVAPPTEDGKSGDSLRLAPEFERGLSAIEADLRERLQRYGIADRVGLRLVDAIRDRRTGEPLEGASGRYGRRIIEVALDARNRTFTFDHEVVHALRDLDLIKSAEWTALQRTVLQDNARMADVRARYPEFGRTNNRPERTERLIEEAVADLFGDWQAGRVQAKGFVRTALERIRDFLRAVGQALRGEGFRTVDSVFRAIDLGEIGRRGQKDAALVGAPAEAHHAETQPRGEDGRFVVGDASDRFSLEQPDPSAAPSPQAGERRRSIMTRLAGAQPIDRVARIPFDLFGGINDRNQWKPGLHLNRQAERLITEAEFQDDGRMGWMNTVLRNARAGLIDRYGLDAAYVERDRQRGLDERRIMAKVPELMKTLADQDVKPEEMATLQAVLTGEEVADARWSEIASPIRAAIDQLGAEAVELGLLSPESFERNRGTYLHRVYAKHEADQGSLAAWVDRKMTGRRRKIIGDQFKGRGMFMEVTHEALMRHTDEAQTARSRSGRLRMLETRRDDLLRRREVALARAEERHDEMGATLERRARLSERLLDPKAAREAERSLVTLRDRRATLDRQRAAAVAELETLSGESSTTLDRRMSVTDAARGTKRDGTPTLKPSGYQKGQAREQGVALTRQSAQTERAREALTRIDHDIAMIDRRIERVSGDIVSGREGIEGRVHEQAAALTRQNLRNQRARALIDKINSQLSDVNSRIVETETRMFAADDLRAAKGQKFRILDKMDEAKEGGQPRVTHRAYLPEGAAIPKELEGYQDRGVWEVRSEKGGGKDGERPGKPVLWRDFTKDERQSMGEIVDARYTVAKTYMLMAHDLATGRFFRDIAQNAEWAHDGKDEPPSATWKEAGDYNRFWHDPAIQWVKVPDTKIPKSNTKRYGALADRFVRAEIWRDMAELEALQKPGVWDHILRQWKANKTYRSPVVHMNNIMSNVMFMDMADVRATDLARGIRSLLKRDDLYREALDQGAFGSDMLAQEIREEVLKPILEEIERGAEANRGFLEATASLVHGTRAAGLETSLTTLGKLADRLFHGVKTADQKMQQAYQMEDEVFRMALYARRRDQGASAEQAALEARDTFLNYDIRAPWINAARRTVLPFISYTYRAAPMIARTIVNRPWKLAKYFTMMYAFNALAYAWDGGDEDEERRSLRENEQGWAWTGIPRMMRLPTHDQHGNPVFLDLRRWIPAGDVFDTGQGQSVIPLPGWMQPGGPLAIGAELLLNRSAFTGQDIINEHTDTIGERIGKTADYVYKSWMPSAAWVPGSWYWQRIANAMEGARDWSGRPYSVPQAVASSVGIKVKPQDVEDGFAAWGREFDRVERELETEARRASNDRERGLLSETGFERKMETLTKKFERLGERRQETFTGASR